MNVPVRLAPFLLTLSACAVGPGADPSHGVFRVTDPTGDGPRVLCVVAHPDDEVAFGGTLYKIATHLGGACDVFVITNGEAGYKYSTLAERLYGLRLTDPAVGRAELPRIRAAEMREAARFLAVRDVILLGETDHRFTTDPGEVLGPGTTVWDVTRIRRELDARLRAERYDFVFVHVPDPTSHGHHQAATILALEAVAALPRDARPVVLAAFPTTRAVERPALPEPLPGHPVTRLRPGVEPFAFDRAQKFGFRDRLDYAVVVNWAITAHRSQGTYQRFVDDWDTESFALFELDVPDAEVRARALFARLAEPQFAPVAYDDDGALVSAVPAPHGDRVSSRRARR
ncbi:MAG: PIG-L family deacetylase [Planctomycetes bacterium]|nr:PIG-L family deacetylase [Planctomycetota bacterium]